MIGNVFLGRWNTTKAEIFNERGGFNKKNTVVICFLLMMTIRASKEQKH